LFTTLHRTFQRLQNFIKIINKNAQNAAKNLQQPVAYFQNWFQLLQTVAGFPAAI